MASLQSFLWLSLLSSLGAAKRSREELRSFEQSGWLLSRKLIAHDEITHVAAKLEAVLSEHGRRAFGDEEEKEVRFTFAVHELDGTVADFVTRKNGSLWQEAAQLAGTEQLCVLMDRGFSKDPGDPETHWHRDDEAISLPQLHQGIRTVHAWIPMRAMKKDLGTLRYLLGTHRRKYTWYEEILAMIWGWEFAWFSLSKTGQDDNLELGDVAWHDGWILHSAGENKGQQVRNGLAISYAYCDHPDQCRGATKWLSPENPACRATELLFDKKWKDRHRQGENDYAKTIITEPLAERAQRFILRSIVGACLGLAVHSLLSRLSGTKTD